MRKIRFTLKPLNAEKKLNALQKQDIQTLDIEKSDTALRFTTEAKYQKQVREILEQNSPEIESENIGISRLISFFRIRIALLVGICLSLVLVFIFSNVLINYEINGLKSIQEREIIDLLKQNGYNIGCTKNALDLDDIQPIILSHFERVAFVSAVFVGNTLVLNLKEQDYDSSLDPNTFTAIYADQTGVVTDIQTLQGTPLVKSGDIVQKGDMLIAPYVQNKGQKVPVQAKGKVYAQVFLKGQVICDTTKPKLIYSGNTYTIRNFNFIGLDCPARCEGDSSILERKYEKNIYTKRLDFLIPIFEQYTVYNELIEGEKPDFDKEKTYLEKQSLYLAYEKVQSDFEIVGQSTQIVESNGIFYVSTYVEIKKDICTIEKEN